MSIKLKPYPEYKDSGLPWLGKIPAHWEQFPIRAFAKPKDLRGRPDLPLLSVYREYGVIPRDARDDNHNPEGADLSTYKVVSVGDLVLNKMKTWQGSLGVSEHHGIVSPAYIVCALGGPIHRRFLHFLLRSRPYINHYNRLSFGVRVNQWDIRYEDFKQISVFLPPIDEQEEIARFLQATDRCISRFIRAKRRLIELLNEQKQAIIHQAVTRGLDPNVRLKPSGIDWLGDIPEHWDARKLKWLAAFNPSKLEAVAALKANETVVFLPMERVSTDGRIDCTDLRPITDVWNGYTYFRRHDVVIAKITPCFENGKGAYLGSLTTKFGFGSTEFIVLRAKQGVDPEYLYFLTSLKTFRALGAEAMTGAAGQQRVPVDFIRNFRVPLPPLDEQRAIVSRIRVDVLALEQAIDRARREIDLIREYRTRLIADVVTGKLDVRGVELPALDEADVPEDWDEYVETEETTETKEVAVDADN